MLFLPSEILFVTDETFSIVRVLTGAQCTSPLRSSGQSQETHCILRLVCLCMLGAGWGGS